MEVVAPFPCNEAAWLAMPWTPKDKRACWLTEDELSRIGTEYFLSMIPVFHFDLMQAGILFDSNLVTVGFFRSPFDGWSSKDLKFTAMVSSEGGLDINIGADIFHVLKHLSVLDPVVQMVLFASCDLSVTVVSEDVCAFRCKKSMVPEGVLDMAKKALSSPRTKRAEEVYTKTGAPGDGEGTGEYIWVTTDADSHRTAQGDGQNVEKNKILKQIKTGSGGSGSKPDGDINMQQQQQQQKQQNVGRVATGVHLWPSVVNEDGLRDCNKWETMTGAMNSMNLLDNMNCNNNSGCKTVSAMAPADCLNQQHFLKDPYQTHQRANGAPVINFTELKGEPELHRIGSDVTAKKSTKNTSAAAGTTWIVASAAPQHATGNRAFLSDFTPEHRDIFLFGGDEGAMPTKVIGRGIVITETMVLPDVWYVPGLAANLVSVSQLVELDYSVAFGRGKCYVRSTADGTVVGAAHAREDGLFALDFLRVPLGL